MFDTFMILADDQMKSGSRISSGILTNGDTPFRSVKKITIQIESDQMEMEQ
jgi:hypothetical protein